MQEYKIHQMIGNSEVEIVPHIKPQGFYKTEAFFVDVKCFPAFKGGDKELMVKVCVILSRLNGGKTELRTQYVVDEVHYEGDFAVSFIRFQVITSICPQCYC